MIKNNVPCFHSSYFVFFLSYIWECLCFFDMFCHSFWDQFLVSSRLQVKNYSQNTIVWKWKCAGVRIRRTKYYNVSWFEKFLRGFMRKF